MQQAFHLGRVGFGILGANALAREVAGKLMQIQGNGEPFLSAHFAVTLYLIIQCRLRAHANCITQFVRIVTPLSSTTTLRGSRPCAVRNSSSVQGRAAAMARPLAMTE